MATELERPYCSLADVQRETVNSLPENDDKYKQCINLASRWVDEFCHRDFWFHDHSENAYKVPRKFVLGDEIFLPFPIVTLTALTVDGKAWDVEDDIYWDGKTISSEDGDFGNYPCRETIRLTGTFGYPLVQSGYDDPQQTPPPTIPSSVKHATAKVAAAISGEKHIEQVGLDGTRIELLDMRIPPEAKALLKRFVLRMNHGL